MENERLDYDVICLRPVAPPAGRPGVYTGGRIPPPVYSSLQEHCLRINTMMSPNVKCSEKSLLMHIYGLQLLQALLNIVNGARS